MRIERMIFILLERVYEIFSTLFFLYLLGMGAFYCLDIEVNVVLIDLFFLLLGLWIGSGITLYAINYLKKVYREELLKRQDDENT